MLKSIYFDSQGVENPDQISKNLILQLYRGMNQEGIIPDNTPVTVK
jgi:hypothetical protein